MGESWIDSYYEALEFFFWEPQHLGRNKRTNTEFDTIEKANAHLRRMEVTLNHNLSQFFMLAPTALRNALFEELFFETFERRFRLHGRGVDTEFELSNAVQPDLLFVADEELVSIEMKVGAKSSVSQVLKYALLGLAGEMHVGAPRRHFLIFLGPGQFSDQWREKFSSSADLRRAISSTDMALFLQKQPVRFREYQARFNDIVLNMRIEFINYPCLAAFLRRASPTGVDDSPGAEVYRKLISGLVGELSRRQLAA